MPLPARNAAPRAARALALLALAAGAAAAGAASPARPNVLYLMADDMRPQLGAYGHAYMRTPHLDALAASALVFDAAYTQFAYCAPSRASFLTGRRPERTRVLNFEHTFREYHPSWTTLPQFFKNAGYFTTAAGKIFHDGKDDPASWSFPSNQTAWFQKVAGDACDAYGNYCAVTNASHVRETDEDLVLAEGLARVRAAAASGSPWFVGVGVHRPHWPSRLPAGWLGPEVYPAAGGAVAPPRHPRAVANETWMSGDYLAGDYQEPGFGCPGCVAPPAHTLEYRRWYYAATSYADFMLGRALALLDELGVRNETIVVFHSDHGYQLGELNEWSKKTNNELATRVPLMVRAPWKPAAAGARSAVRAELVDLYRTLVDLAGLDARALEPDVQGASLAPLFDAPTAPPPALAQKPAFSQIGRCGCTTYTRHNWTGLECGDGACAAVNVTDFGARGPHRGRGPRGGPRARRDPQPLTHLPPPPPRQTLWATLCARRRGRAGSAGVTRRG